LHNQRARPGQATAYPDLPASSGEVYRNPIELTISELADVIVKLTGSRSEIVLKPLPADGPEHRQPNIGFARERQGWEPITDLAKGLAQTVDYFSHRLSHG